jgi:hypothetical protein
LCVFVCLMYCVCECVCVCARARVRPHQLSSAPCAPSTPLQPPNLPPPPQVERFVFRPGLSERAHYYAAITLNQLALSARPQEGGGALAKKLVEIYFRRVARGQGERGAAACVCVWGRGVCCIRQVWCARISQND